MTVRRLPPARVLVDRSSRRRPCRTGRPRRPRPRRPGSAPSRARSLDLVAPRHEPARRRAVPSRLHPHREPCLRARVQPCGGVLFHGPSCRLVHRIGRPGTTHRHPTLLDPGPAAVDLGQPRQQGQPGRRPRLSRCGGHRRRRAPGRAGPAGISGPVSSTAMTTPPWSEEIFTHTGLPGAVLRPALPSSVSIICSVSAGSTSIDTCSPRSSRRGGDVRPTPRPRGERAPRGRSAGGSADSYRSRSRPGRASRPRAGRACARSSRAADHVLALVDLGSACRSASVSPRIDVRGRRTSAAIASWSAVRSSFTITVTCGRLPRSP